MARINLLDPDLGIQNVLEEPARGASLPQYRQMAANALSEAGLEALYAPSNTARIVEEALCPDVGDGTLVQPAVFSACLARCAEKLSGKSGSPALRELLEKELDPLLENRELLNTYMGLLIKG